VLDGGLDDVPCADVAREVKQLQPKMPIIVIAAPGFTDCPEADYQLESFDPARLLEILRSLKPEASAEIEKRNEQLSLEKRL
jgi:hypothetical protein